MLRDGGDLALSTVNSPSLGAQLAGRSRAMRIHPFI